MSTQQSNLLTEVANAFTNFSTENFINNFHFIRPEWLLAFLALFLVLFLLKKIRYYQSPWQHFLPAHLANALLENSNNSTRHASKQTTAELSANKQGRYWLKPFIIGSCTIFALAGPAWQKLPQPVYQLERGAVLIMDMSYSMYATDVKPNRLTRARYKAIDLLKKINEGDVGLIAYAGDAFIISPLTQDIKNIELLLPSLSPDIMPVHGANALAALTLADQTLKNAGHVSGDIYWFTDDVENTEMSDVYAWANDNAHNLNILGIGSQLGAPIKLSSGKLLKDNKGAIVIPKLPEGRLSAIAKRSRGVYHTISNDDADIKALTAHLSINLDDKIAADSATDSSKSEQIQKTKQALQGDQYQEQGPWLLILILPLILSYFRRGSSILSITALIPLTFYISLMSITPTIYAAESSVAHSASSSKPTIEKSAITEDGSTEQGNSEQGNSASQLWRDLWQTSDQQGQEHYQKKDYSQAANQFKDSQWQGSAHYKAGDYQQALDAFKQSDTAQALYNQGNSLAQLQQIDEAIDAYKQALAKDPNLSDAKDNLAKLEELKKQQEQSQQDSDQDSEQSEDGQKEEQDKNQDQDQQKQDSEQQSQDKSQGDKQQSEQEQDQQQSDEAQEQKDQAEQKQQESNEAKEKKEQEEQASQAEQTDEKQQTAEEKALAQQASDNKAQETQQKHQQLLNKVTDDPYLLLRNKMRLEYQKRRNERAPQGETKKW